MTHSYKILNFEALARTDARRKLLQILEAGYGAIDVKRALNSHVRMTGSNLTIHNQGEHVYNLDAFDHIYVLGIGKAALNTAQALESILGDRINDGVVLDIRKGDLKYIKTLAGSHPLPSEQNTKAAKQIIDIAANATERDLVIVIVSGGGSALLCYPFDLECEQSRQLYEASVSKGLTIQQMNTVRKHISQVKGGHLAKILHPATVIGLILSDIPGDQWDLVASGPTYKDNSTIASAQAIIDDFDLPQFRLTETPTDSIYFDKVTNVGILCNKFGLDAMTAKAQQLGYYPVIHSAQLQSDAYETGKLFTSLSKPKHAILAGGETSVIITKPGKGGRCESVGLGAFEYLHEGQTFAAIASDGRDNTEAAGVIIDSTSVAKARELGLDPQRAIDENRAFPFFEQLDDLIITGPTGTNVSDLMVIIEDPGTD